MQSILVFGLLFGYLSIYPTDMPDNDMPNQSDATILLITNDDLKESWSRFAQWKTQSGKPTKVVTVSQIEEKYEGKDVQDKIRHCCIDHIDQHNTRWVILGGDSQADGKGVVPDRDTHHLEFYRYKDIPTDVYYLSQKDWDANSDGVYGQFSTDLKNIEHTNPNACIGRIPVRSKKDVLAYTDKVISYESCYPEIELAERLIYTCPEPGAYLKLHTSRDELSKQWKNGSLDQFFANKTPWDRKTEGDHQLIPNNWVELINANKAGKLHMHGHGLVNLWALEQHKNVSYKQIDQLQNKNAYLTMTTVSCFTGQYDAEQDPSITEAILRKPEGGAVLVVAPSREGIPIFSDPKDMRKMVMEGKMDGTTELLTRYWQHGLSNPELTAGEALQMAKSDFAERVPVFPGYHFLLCELNLLGDPSLHLRSQSPKTPVVDVPTYVDCNKQDLLIKTDAPGSTICLMQNTGVYQVLKSDENGNAKYSIQLSVEEPILVTVSGPNLNTVQKKIDVKKIVSEN